MLCFPRFRSGVVITALFFACLTGLSARAVNVSAVNASATIHDGLANVSFKIEVANTADSAMTNVFAVFEDGTDVSLGDIDAGATVQSAQQSRTVDIGDSASRSIPIKITLKYSQDGDTIETPTKLAVFADEGARR